MRGRYNRRAFANPSTSINQVWPTDQSTATRGLRIVEGVSAAAAANADTATAAATTTAATDATNAAAATADIATTINTAAVLLQCVAIHLEAVTRLDTIPHPAPRVAGQF